MPHKLVQIQNLPRIRQYVGVLLTRRWVVLAAVVMTVAVTALLTFTRPPVYRATSRLLIETKKPQAVGLQEVYEPSDARSDYYETQYRLLKDRHLAERVFENLRMGDRPEYAGLSNPALRFAEAIQVEPIRSTRLVDVSYDSPDPALAREIADALVAAYVDDNRQREASTAQRALKELAQQAGEIEPKFHLCAMALQTFKEKNTLITVEGVEGATNDVLERLGRLNQASTEAEIRRIAAQAEYELARRLLAEGGSIASQPTIAENPVFQKLTMELFAAEQERAELMQKYLPQHPRRVAVEARITALYASVQEERQHVLEVTRAENQRLLETVRARFERSQAEEVDLRTALAQQKGEALHLSRLVMQYKTMKDEANRVGRLYDVVLERIKEIDLMAEMAHQNTNVFVIHKASLPDTAIGPQKRTTMALALIAGLLLGVGMAFLLDHLDTTIKGKQDVEDALGLPVLGYVPNIPQNGDPVTACRDMVGVRDQASPAAEAFRTIRTGITFSAATKRMRRILVTSANPREGKTLVAVNTAASLARSGARVLLVDSDMRRPHVHRVFGLHPKTGLASYLVASNGDLALERVVQSTGVPNLDILPCDRPPPNPAELLGSPRMKALLREAAKKYDRIVFDSPPALSSADASILSSHADGVLVVVRAFNTDRRVVQRTKETLEAVQGNIIGVVLNDVDNKKSTDYYGYGYYGYGRYHPYKSAGTNDDGDDGDGHAGGTGTAASAEGTAGGDAAASESASASILLVGKGDKA